MNLYSARIMNVASKSLIFSCVISWSKNY